MECVRASSEKGEDKTDAASSLPPSNLVDLIIKA